MHSVRAVLASGDLGADTFPSCLALVITVSANWYRDQCSLRIGPCVAVLTSAFVWVEELSCLMNTRLKLRLAGTGRR